MRPARWTVGVGLILLGGWFLLYNSGKTAVSPWNWWPLLLLALGVGLHLFAWSSRDAEGALVPAGVLAILGLLFLACETYGWAILDRLWPIFPLAPGIGLLEAYVYVITRERRFSGVLETGSGELAARARPVPKKAESYLIAAIVPTAVGVMGLGFTLAGTVARWLAPLVLVIIGLLLVAPGRRTREA
ncbi:MAG: hypothetical protein IMX01_01110 [Limnochordaceae bacterium]|nr:hypothetical protein [Limnochordaceae bacterium]